MDPELFTSRSQVFSDSRRQRESIDWLGERAVATRLQRPLFANLYNTDVPPAHVTVLGTNEPTKSTVSGTRG
jgi:hypothetical protein